MCVCVCVWWGGGKGGKQYSNALTSDRGIAGYHPQVGYRVHEAVEIMIHVGSG